MSTTPTPPAPSTVKLVGKNGAKALKTFEWSATADDKDVTFLKGHVVTGFPEKLVDAYRKKGLIEPKVTKATVEEE